MHLKYISSLYLYYAVHNNYTRIFQIDVIKSGELRLANGLHKYDGRVEMYWNSEWRIVCYDGWDELDAQVICRQLNYLSTSVQILGVCIYYEYYCIDNSIFYSYFLRRGP